MPYTDTGIVKDKLKHLLSENQPRLITDAGRIPSAVLLPLFLSEDQYHILFIKRTETVKAHKGQISFPGGSREPGETLRDTAIRECTEEIGVRAADVEVLGGLDDELTVSSNYVVSTFVGIIPWPYQFTLAREEVAEIVAFPVKALPSFLS